MKYALINPCWTFHGSIYFGCREPHLPLEYGYAKVLLERGGHEVMIVDGQLENLVPGEIERRVHAFNPDFTVMTTAPSYLFWRCPPPELRVPQELAFRLRSSGGILVAVGPHGSVTPRAVMSKLGADVVVLGECEEILPRLATLSRASRDEWEKIPSICYSDGGEMRIQGGPCASDMSALPAIRWPAEMIGRHHHHHHRFDSRPFGPGAEMETSRGCPFSCSFCARNYFRGKYRKRPMPVILEELDGIIGQRTGYVYFIDEIFLPDRELVEAIMERGIKFGIQTRIDLWDPPMFELLGRAGCVSIEAGVESISEEGRRRLNKKCALSPDELVDRLIRARERVPFVQATLLDAQTDAPDTIAEWRTRLHRFGVWTNKPVPVFPYPGSEDYERKWGIPDDGAWERAHEYYLRNYHLFSDIQDGHPLPLKKLELGV